MKEFYSEELLKLAENNIFSEEEKELIDEEYKIISKFYEEE